MSKMEQRLNALKGDGGHIVDVSKVTRSPANEGAGGHSPSTSPIAERAVSLG